MTDGPKKIYLTAPQAKRKWGEILHEPSRTYRHFEDAGGIWHPELQGGELTGYRWQKVHQVKNKHWRRR
jgi:hypothetical protein